MFSHALEVIHGVLSVPVAVSGFADPIMMIDKTDGVEAEPAEGTFPTLIPAAVVRRSALAEYSITPAQMVGRLIGMNGQTWKVLSTRPRPTPEGEAAGEIYLYLRRP